MKPELKFGLLSGAAVSVWLLATSLAGFHFQRLEVVKYSGTLSLVVLAGFIRFALKSARDRAPDGALTLEQGWRTGTLIALVSASVSALFKVAHNHVLNPGWVEKAIAWERARMEAQQAAPRKIERMETFLRTTNGDLFLVTFGILDTVVLGTFIALGLAASMKRPPRGQEDGAASPPA